MPASFYTSREDSKVFSHKFHHNKHFNSGTACRSLISHCVLIRDRCFMLPHFHSNQWHPASSSSPSRVRHRPLRWNDHFKIHSLFSGHYFTLYYDSLERRTHLKPSKLKCVTVRIAFIHTTPSPLSRAKWGDSPVIWCCCGRLQDDNSILSLWVHSTVHSPWWRLWPGRDWIHTEECNLRLVFI